MRRLEIRQPENLAEFFRQVFLFLGILGILGTAADLIILEHWEGLQLFAWATLILMAFCIIGIIKKPSHTTIRVSRYAGVVVFLTGLYGVIEHSEANFEFIKDLHPDWSTSKLIIEAITGKVPTMAPLIVIQIALCVVAATLFHPRGEKINR